MNLADTKYWDELYQVLPLNIASERSVVRQWIEQWVGPGTGSCLEIGCFPGRYLAVFGELGYRLSGIDLTSRILAELPTWLAGQGYRLGEFLQEDFREFAARTERTFDVVCSFGFIEHFTDWPAILREHGRLVRRGGLLVVSAPNFSGLLQRVLHTLLDRENLTRHNLEAMCPQQWAEALAPLGFDPLFAGHFGRFDFWVDSPMTPLQRLGYRGVKAGQPLLRKLPVSGFSSPHCGIVSRNVGR